MDPGRHPRVAARRLRRYLEVRNEATIEEVGIVVACLGALGGDDDEAAQTLRTMAERATNRG
jgi:hypothetical protein